MSKVKLGEVARESREKWDKGMSGVPIVGLEHLIPDGIRIESFDVNSNNTFTKKFVKGQVLFGRRRAYQRKAAMAEFDGVCSGDITVIESIKEKLIPDLLPFIIQTPAFFDFANQGSAGSLSPRVKWDHLAEYEFELPSLAEQRVLKDKLWAAYRLKEGYKKLLVSIDEMVKSQFVKMLELNTKFDTIGNISTYIGKGITPNYVESSSIAVINQACVYWDELRTENVRYHNESIVAKKLYLVDNDVLLNATGTGTLGRSCVFKSPDNEKKYISDGHVLVIKTRPNVILPEVLAMYFSLNDTQDEIYRQYVTGSTNQIDIVFAQFKKMLMPTPGIDEQNRFVDFKQQADKSKLELKQCIDNIDKVIKSLING